MKRNNPGNIRAFIDASGNISKPFYGETTPDIKPGNKSGFRVFDTTPAGYRALFKVLKNNYLESGYDTIRKIFPRYAPATDNNDPNHYINFVEAKTNIPRDRKLSTYAELIPIVKAITEMEHGETADPNEVKLGYESINDPTKLIVELLPGQDSTTPGQKNKFIKPVLIGAGLLTAFFIYRHYAKKKISISR